MLTKIKILIVEHDLHDLEMIETELRRGDVDFVSEVVQNESCYRKALENFIPDIILSDYRFPSFDGRTAFMIREQVAPHTPFILVSGTIGEENSIELIKNGVTDFVLKDKLFTLVPKVNRALRDLKAWKKKEEIQKQLVLSEAQLAEVQEIAKVGSWVTDLSDLSVKWSRETFRIYGMEEQTGSVSHTEFLEIVHPKDRLHVETVFKNSLATSSVNTAEHRIITSSGELKFVEENWKIIRDEQGIPLQAMGSCQDITERIKEEEQKEFERRNKEALINSTDDLMWSVSNDLKLIAVNNAFIKAIELSTGKMVKPGDHVFMPGYFPDSIVQYWTNLYERALAGNSFKENVYTPSTYSSPEKWNETSFNAIYKDGLVTGCACFSRDITETKKSETSILKAYEEKNTVLESIDDGFFATDKNLLVNYWNSKAEILLGVKKEDILGKNLHETFADSSSPVFYDNYQKALRENSTIRFEGFSNRTKKWFAVSAFATDNGLSVYFKDVSEQKNDEEKLKVSELRYRSLIEQATDTICLWDASGKFNEVNPSGCKMFGYSREEMLQLFITDVLFEEDLKTNPIKIDELKSGLTTHNERRIKRKDGSAVEVELNGKMLEDGKIIVFGRDISERKESERLIKESEAKFRSFFESSMDGILLTVTDGAILSANPAACEIFKMTEAEICAAGRMGLVDITDPRLHSLLKERQRTGRAKGELTLLRKDGNKFEAELTSAVFTDSFGRERTSMIIRDISERKAAELNLSEKSKELQHTLNDLSNIMDFSMDIICTVDNKGKFVRVSAASQAIWGYSPQELINTNYISILHADDIEESEAKDIEIKNGFPISMFENRFVHKNGSIVPMLWSANWDEHDQLMYCIGKDATEKKRLEKANDIERQRFLGLYLQAPSCMGILKGSNHVFEMANPLYLQLINKSDIIGKTVKEVLPEMESQGILGLLDSVYKSGNAFTANEMLVKFDLKSNGEMVDSYLNFVYQAHRNHEGDIDGIVFFGVDVTEQVLSRHKIEESGKRYRQIVETAQEGIWLIDENHKTTFVNSKMCEILEYSEAEMMGKDIFYFMDDEAKELAAKLMEQKKDGQSDQKYFKYISKSGNEVWTNLSANPLFDNNGNYKGSLAMVTDITKKKRAEQEMTWLINNTEEAFILLDQNLNIISYNNQFQQLYENYLARTVAKGECILTYAQPERRQLLKEIYERVLQGAEEEYEMNIPLPDKSVKIFALKYKPAKDEDGKIIGVFVSTIDVTEKKKSEQQLIIQEKRYRALVDNGEDGVVILSPEGKLQYTSPTTEKILGYSEEELWKLNMFSLIHPDDLATATKVWEQVMNNPGIALPDNTIRMLHKNGSWRWLEATLTNMLHDPSLNGIVDNFRDITERIEGEQLREFERIDKEALINTTSDFMWSISSDFRLIAANASFTNYMKNFDPRPLMPGDELLSKEIMPAEYLAKWKELFKSALRGESLIKEMHSPSEEKHLEQWFETTLHPIYNNNKVTGIACYSKDITERKQSEIHLIKLNEDLQKQAKELVLSNIELEQFAYVASHDLQEPLRMITSFLSRLEKKYGTVLDEKGKQYIHFAVDGAKRMRQIILDLLEFSRVGRTEDKQEVIDLNKVVNDIKILFRKQIQEKNAVIISKNLPQVPGYKSPLRQVFQNLISNALKFVNHDQASKIKITCLEFNDHWQFAVRDNGIGIEQEYFDKIFIIFQRLHNKDEYSGTGMGLAITKKIIENQGGKIWVESEEGKGSTFYFTIQKN